MSTTLPSLMHAVQLCGYGGLEQLNYRHDVPVPTAAADQVLIRVSAAGINNTDINTRTGWYNRTVTSGTTSEGGAAGFGVSSDGMGEWGADFNLPRIQGADVVGRIVAVGGQVEAARIGQRVVCDPYILDPANPTVLDSAGFLGANCDGGFAQFCALPAANAYEIPASVTLSDEQIATLPCSGGTAMNMLLQAAVGSGDVMLVTGASGGVGTFLVQIGKYLGATVIAVASPSKHAALVELGATTVIDRGAADLAEAVRSASGYDRVSVVADVVGGDAFSQYVELLRRGGRYVTAGAIAGPIVELDLRSLYLKSLEFYGSSVYRRDCFPTLLRILAAGGLEPRVDSVRPLHEIAAAQQAFLEKKHIGSLVLKPPR